MLENFNEFQLFNLSFSGAVPKVCAMKNNKLFMIKLDNDGEFKCLSEYLAYRIAELLRLDCQHVSLGFRDNKLACGIHLFNNGSGTIHHYYDINDSSVSSLDLDVRDLPYTLDFILDTLSNYKSINIPNDELIDNFIDMCLFDCLIGNYDRHWGNWGFIGFSKNYEVCPLFDNGSSLYPKLSDDEMTKILNSKKEIYKIIYEFPKSQIRRTKKKKYLYKDLMIDLFAKGYESRFVNFVNKFESKLHDFDLLFEDAYLKQTVSETRLRFLHDVILMRFNLLIKDVLKCK